MDTNAIVEKTLAAVRGNDAAIQQVLMALLSHNAAEVQRVFHDMAGMDLTEQQAQVVIQSYGTQEAIAACT